MLWFVCLFTVGGLSWKFAADFLGFGVYTGLLPCCLFCLCFWGGWLLALLWCIGCVNSVG